jgi:hypothetical protein
MTLYFVNRYDYVIFVFVDYREQFSGCSYGREITMWAMDEVLVRTVYTRRSKAVVSSLPAMGKSSMILAVRAIIFAEC